MIARWSQHIQPSCVLDPPRSVDIDGRLLTEVNYLLDKELRPQQGQFNWQGRTEDRRRINAQTISRMPCRMVIELVSAALLRIWYTEDETQGEVPEVGDKAREVSWGYVAAWLRRVGIDNPAFSTMTPSPQFIAPNISQSSLQSDASGFDTPQEEYSDYSDNDDEDSKISTEVK
mmetsp:Transcript_300/g.545  ORF Transcript_300/g.545 Transcript_300/m.545 type:complete len:174 (+) Transcript_300:780-1301(+)|eukprot:CAMPEP_0185021010 /NCGR_PEP_ID=MMETSP1103-20130426/3673_1 /TAXON_ID=36769 /ORGANISM="Paraphysomonas bandaiensis, Strain Caron Lab Isolate" /LENGTH=173 /DNA_ID=CAMNT_0027552281 /DNA_START=713 /DNA_END=1234 /DNA_ORIENTATION=-